MKSWLPSRECDWQFFILLATHLILTPRLAVDYLFLTNDGGDSREDLVVDSFNAVNEQNDYEVFVISSPAFTSI